MKVKRLKHARKCLTFYKNNFGFFEPYQILIDGTFCQAALQFKINIKEQLPKYLGGELQLLTTKCVIGELEGLGTMLYGATLVAKRFQLRNCGHFKEAKPAADCIKSMIGEDNSKRYIVATQDRDVQEYLRAKPGVPLLHILYNTIVLEKPSVESAKKATKTEAEVLEPAKHEKETIEKLKSAVETNDEVRIKRKRKKVKGPNPLSCKKKKKTSETPVVNTEHHGGKKKRKKRKIAAHVLEALQSQSK